MYMLKIYLIALIIIQCETADPSPNPEPADLSAASHVSAMMGDNSDEAGANSAAPDTGGEGDDGGPDQDEDEEQEKEFGDFPVHEQPEPVETGEDGRLPVVDEYLPTSHRIENIPRPEELSYENAIQMSYMIRERHDDVRCATSVAACDAYSPMWPQVDGLCDLFFVKCLVDAAGMLCRNYTEKTIFQNAPDLCDNVSDLCSQNREAVIAFCWSYLYHEYGEITMKPMPKKSKAGKFVEYLIS